MRPAFPNLYSPVASHIASYTLAGSVGRNYSNIHTDIGKLEEHGLVRRTPDDTVFVPFEAVEIHLALVKQAA